MVMRRLVMAFFLVGVAGPTYGDQFHYNNFLIGDRAIGLAGAFGAVSDDASGVFYNPAGLAFALSNDVSGSANALYTRKVVYEKTIGGSNFEERSGGSLPSFFGGLQKLDNLMKGLVLAFGVYTTDSELKDQDDLIEGVTLGSSAACGDEVVPGLKLERFHRTVNQRGATFHAAGALAWRISNVFSVGLGVDYVTVDELVQEYQDVRTNISVCSDAATSKVVDQTEQKLQNIRQHLKGTAVVPVLGMQTSIAGRLSLGMTLKAGSFISQSFEQSVEARGYTLLDSDQARVKAAKGQAVAIGTGFISQLDALEKVENPLGSLPPELRFASALFYSTRLLMTFDVTYTGSTSDNEKVGTLDLYSREAVINWATGMEYYLVPSIPVRVGVFSNNDARPEIDKNKSGQRDHIDYTGGTLFLAWVQPNSQISVGFVVQQGTGEAQKLAASKAVQTVKADALTFAFSATHSF